MRGGRAGARERVAVLAVLAVLVGLQVEMTARTWTRPFLDGALHYDFDNADFTRRARDGILAGQARTQLGVSSLPYAAWEVPAGEPRRKSRRGSQDANRCLRAPGRSMGAGSGPLRQDELRARGFVHVFWQLRFVLPLAGLTAALYVAAPGIAWRAGAAVAILAVAAQSPRCTTCP